MAECFDVSMEGELGYDPEGEGAEARLMLILLAYIYSPFLSV